MNTYQIINLVFIGGSFLVALLTYIEIRYKKRKK